MKNICKNHSCMALPYIYGNMLYKSVNMQEFLCALVLLCNLFRDEIKNRPKAQLRLKEALDTGQIRGPNCHTHRE